MRVPETLVKVDLMLTLRLLGRANMSGVVTVTNGTEKARIYLHEGRVVNATATNARRVGEALVARGLISPEVLEDALIHQKRKKVKQPLATILHELGVVSRAVAEAEVETQVAFLLREVFGWEEVALKFTSGRIAADNILFPADNLEEVVKRMSLAMADEPS